jgi:hypothetical protein
MPFIGPSDSPPENRTEISATDGLKPTTPPPVIVITLVEFIDMVIRIANFAEPASRVAVSELISSSRGDDVAGFAEDEPGDEDEPPHAAETSRVSAMTAVRILPMVI